MSGATASCGLRRRVRFAMRSRFRPRWRDRSGLMADWPGQRRPGTAPPISSRCCRVSGTYRRKPVLRCRRPALGPAGSARPVHGRPCPRGRRRRVRPVRTIRRVARRDPCTGGIPHSRRDGRSRLRAGRERGGRTLDRRLRSAPRAVLVPSCSSPRHSSVPGAALESAESDCVAKRRDFEPSCDTPGAESRECRARNHSVTRSGP